MASVSGKLDMGDSGTRASTKDVLVPDLLSRLPFSFVSRGAPCG